MDAANEMKTHSKHTWIRTSWIWNASTEENSCLFIIESICLAYIFSNWHGNRQIEKFFDGELQLFAHWAVPSWLACVWLVVVAINMVQKSKSNQMNSNRINFNHVLIQRAIDPIKTNNSKHSNAPSHSRRRSCCMNRAVNSKLNQNNWRKMPNAS